MDELERILSAETAEVPTQPAGETKVSQEETTDNNEVKAKEEQLANLNKAIAREQQRLKEIRAAKRQSKEEFEEDIPKINFEDPSSKAWARHIKESVSPVQAELEKEREEIRSFALRRWLSEKPDLARNSEKLKVVMENYERTHTASERTEQGVLLDLDRAYAYSFPYESSNLARQEYETKAQSDILFSDAGVSRGATTYSTPKQSVPRLSQDDQEILSKWGMTPQEWVEDKKKYG